VKEFDMQIEQDLLSEVRMFIKAKRKMRKLTQLELSQKAGVGLRFIRELEQGTKNNFNTGSIEKVLRLFGNFKFTITNVS
jgi:transcriptional regulator with XRE-family HTH domain